MSELASRRCAFCEDPILRWRPGTRFCSTKCRQASFRLSRYGVGRAASSGASLRYAYADPPYPGTAARYYKDRPEYAGEVDHHELIARLSARYASGELDGFALSTSEKALQWILPLMPKGTRTCPWVKAIGVPPATYGPHNTWEPLLVVGGRKRQGVRQRDWLCAHPARGGGDLPGRKPLRFWAFLFAQLGMLPGDTFEDLYPGTGTGSRAWVVAAHAMARGI